MEKILEKNVSIQNNTWSKITDTTSIRNVLEIIRSNKYKEITEFLRKILYEDPKRYTVEKQKLTAVTFSATFNQIRNGENVQEYNKLIVIDIDKLNSESIKTTFDKLLKNQFVYSFWVSPSGNGFKGIVPIEYNFDISKYELNTVHKHAFQQLTKHFIVDHGIELDKSGSDITRLCFISHDINLVINKNATEFKVEQIGNEKTKIEKSNNKITIKTFNKTILNVKGKNNSFHRKEMSSIIRFLNKNNKSITYEYDNWNRVAMAIATSFNFDIGIRFFLDLSSLDTEKFNEENCTKFLKECYIKGRNEISFKTIRFLAIQEGYTSKKLGEESSEALI